MCAFVLSFSEVQEFSFLTEILGNLESHVANAEETVVFEGEPAQGIFFIHSGLCEIRASFLKPPSGMVDLEDAAADEFGCIVRAIGSNNFVKYMLLLLLPPPPPPPLLSLPLTLTLLTNNNDNNNMMTITLVITIIIITSQ